MDTPKPGIYPDASFADYLSWDAASHSKLWPLTRSAAHARWNLDHQTETKAMSFGRALHCSILEPERFEDEYAEEIVGDGRTVPIRDARKAQVAAGLIVLGTTEWETLRGITNFIEEHPEGESIRNMLGAPGAREVSLVWDHPLSDGRVVRCKCRPDILLEAPALAVDLKSTETADPINFAWDVVKYGYHLQASLVLSATTALGMDTESYVLAALSKKGPYLCKAHILDQLWFDMGNELLDRLLCRWATCIELDQWPGYGAAMEVLMPPPNAYKRVFGDEDEEDDR
mgnify:CR=1 FL=1